VSYERKGRDRRSNAGVLTGGFTAWRERRGRVAVEAGKEDETRPAGRAGRTESPLCG
jgi:hypothetical protein